MLLNDRALWFTALFLVVPAWLHREVVTDLIDEYKAAERADYVTYGGSGSGSGSAGAGMVPPGGEPLVG